jgi:L-Ala-D/L-Glu epimerase / N-acetyl-D-glutamate racemase
VIVAEITMNGHRGWGECVPYARYGETAENVVAAIEKKRGDIERGASRAELQRLLTPGAARNALDCALIDLEAKLSGQSAHTLLGLPAPAPMRTAVTISLDSPEAMARAAREAAQKDCGTLKIKLAGSDDIERIDAIRAAAPGQRLIADANEGFSADGFAKLMPALVNARIALIEQPLKADADEALANFDSPIPICADESCHTREDLPRLRGRYSVLNIKLDKTGGLSEAVALASAAKAEGFRIMASCMVATSLSMAPAMLLASFADYLDLDGPLWLARDREPGLVYDNDLVQPPAPALWG